MASGEKEPTTVAQEVRYDSQTATRIRAAIKKLEEELVALHIHTTTDHGESVTDNEALARFQYLNQIRVSYIFIADELDSSQNVLMKQTKDKDKPKYTAFSLKKYGFKKVHQFELDEASAVSLLEILIPEDKTLGEVGNAIEEASYNGTIEALKIGTPLMLKPVEGIRAKDILGNYLPNSHAALHEVIPALSPEGV